MRPCGLSSPCAIRCDTAESNRLLSLMSGRLPLFQCIAYKQPAKREESKARYLQAEKEENAKKGHVSEAACIGLPFGFSDDTILHHVIVKPQCNDSAMF